VNYKQFSAIVGADESIISDTAQGPLKVIGDGKVLHIVQNISSNKAGTEIAVNIEGVMNLEINMDSDRNGLLNMIIAQPSLLLN
ncbi:MAG: hypothetical protein K0R67_1259, partial [Paenibacillus sp.]|nr:hypothetical protein [Paenibacillus sp.]